MLAIRAAKIVTIAAVAFFATLVAFGNITDYGTNFAFVQHVLDMDSIFPDATIKVSCNHQPVPAPWGLQPDHRGGSTHRDAVLVRRLPASAEAARRCNELQPREGVGSGRPDARLSRLAGRLHSSAASGSECGCPRAYGVPDAFRFLGDHSWRDDLR